MKNHYKICKFVNGNGEEWYQIKKKGWFFWYYLSAYLNGALSSRQTPIRFYSMKEVNEHIKLDSMVKKSSQIKRLECFDYETNR